MNVEEALSLNRRERIVLDGSRIQSIDAFIAKHAPTERPIAVAMAVCGLVEDGVRSHLASASCNLIRRRIESRERGPRGIYKG